MKEKKTIKESPQPVLHAERSQVKSATVHNEGSLTHARCRPACRALERRRRCGHQGRIFHTSNTLDSQTFAYNCFEKTSKKTHTMTFLCLQLYSFVKREQEVPPQQRLLRAADLLGRAPRAPLLGCGPAICHSWGIYIYIYLSYGGPPHQAHARDCRAPALPRACCQKDELASWFCHSRQDNETPWKSNRPVVNQANAFDSSARQPKHRVHCLNCEWALFRSLDPSPASCRGSSVAYHPLACPLVLAPQYCHAISSFAYVRWHNLVSAVGGRMCSWSLTNLQVFPPLHAGQAYSSRGRLAPIRG